MKRKISALILAYAVLLTNPAAVQAQNYSETDITIGPYALEGRLVVPANAENPPVAIFVHGSGQVNFDSAAGAITPFKDIAHGLGNAGIASVRFNKRFYQHPPIPPDMTLETEFLKDVSYAINWAYNHDDLGDIYLIGFSLGGILAPTIAYRHEEVMGIISLAGSPRRFSDIIVSQSEMLNYMYAHALGVELPEGFPIGALINLIMTANPEMLMSDNIISRLAHEFGFPISYLFSLREINTYAVIGDLHIPMLFLHGSEDLQVSAAYDFAAWYYLLNYRDNVDFILYEGLNHFFTPHVPELGYWQTRAPAQVSVQVINDIAWWINER